MKKIKPSDLRREAAAMVRDGSMPSLDTVLQAVADAREKYSAEIKGSQTSSFMSQRSQTRSSYNIKGTLRERKSTAEISRATTQGISRGLRPLHRP
jgi:hypothetical protein